MRARQNDGVEQFMNRRASLMSFLTFFSASAVGGAIPWQPDRGDGTYRNPILHADYSDPDAIRVGDDFWMVSSSFSHVPGLPILHSTDLVNWRLVAHALPRLQPLDTFATPQHGKGVWAPSLRHHDGKFWIYYPDPDFGLYLVTATDPRGPWSEPVLVRPGRGLIDPCPLWDDDGSLYLIHGWAKSRAGIANILSLLKLTADGTSVSEDLGVLIDGHARPGYTTLEGPKLYRRDGWYYIFAPAGGVKTGWQSVFRSRSLRGPYEDRIVLAQGRTPINGPHQGALIDLADGTSWFLHFQDKHAYGRVVHLQPVAWRDGWPVPGSDPEGDGLGEPVLVHPKPIASPASALAAPPSSDDFAGPRLGPQWQWQANPRDDWHSLTERPGWLRLFAQPIVADNLYTAPHLLLQKFPAPEFVVTTQLDFNPAHPGDSAGLLVFGYDYAWIGLREGQLVQVAVRHAHAQPSAITHRAPLPPTGPVFLRVSVNNDAICRFAFSSDGKFYSPLGEPFKASVGHWVGAKVGLFAAGHPVTLADFRHFIVQPSPP